MEVSREGNRTFRRSSMCYVLELRESMSFFKIGVASVRWLW